MGAEEATLNQISGKVGRLEVMQENSTKAITEMAASVNKLVEKLDRSDDVAKEALEKSKSAHKRLDGIDKIIFWVSTTIIGLVLVALVGLVITKS